MIDKEKYWEEKFPRLVNFLGCQFSQDFSIYGIIIEELTGDFALRAGLEGTIEVISQMDQLISLMTKGEIDPDQFLKDLKEDRIPNYDHLSRLQYFEAIRSGLEENKKKIYGT